MSGKAGGKRPIIIRREEVVEGGHHGGAWKVAYADFVTAMMAFFLLMWLLNATTDEQRRGLADYFSPMNPLARGASGSGQPFGGKTPFETGELVSDRGTMAVVAGRANEQAADEALLETSLPHHLTVGKDEEPSQAASEARKPGDPQARAEPAPNTSTALTAELANPALRISPDAKMMAMLGTKTPASAAVSARAAIDEAALQAEQDRREGAAFFQAAQQIQNAVQGDKLLESVAQQLSIDITQEGLRIQLLDEDRRPMFALGSTTMTDRARLLLQKVAPALLKLSEPVSIAGHTDAAPFRNGDKGNWELSSERANVTRRILVEAGLPESRIRSVTGNADRDLLLPADPLAAANRRIAIVVLRTAHAAKAPGTPAR
jgi:chemotaxis protein MotB